MRPTAATRDSYAIFYDRLKVLRDDFHRIGRFNDANAKLDELCKLFVLKHVSQKHPPPCGRSRLSRTFLAQLAAKRLGNATNIAGALHLVFDDLRKHDESSLAVLGKNPSLDIDPTDDEFAESLLPVIESLPLNQPAGGWSFDLLNEAFGHFVQDSFRHRKEDAQYLTPPEVVSAMVEIGVHDLLSNYPQMSAEPDLNAEQHKAQRKFIVADPTCGVGSFLAATFCHSQTQIFGDRPLIESLEFVGQDKVERMVRLAKVNMQLFTNTTASIRLGNSVSGDTLDDLNGKVDLVLTNPPFGATFERSRLFGSQLDQNNVDPRRFPILYALSRKRSLPNRIDSEFLMFDRSLSLLREGGRMLIVVPDKVVAADGFAAEFRAAATEAALLHAVIDLPSESFAQAGTRTKTSIVYLQRRSDQQSSNCGESQTKTRATNSVFMATVDDLGFRVATRSGATIKTQNGHNQLAQLPKLYQSVARNVSDDLDLRAHCESPSAATVPTSDLINGRWNASFYRSDRIQALVELDRLTPDSFNVQPLSELVQIDPNHDIRVDANHGDAIISVLHVREDGFIDVDSVNSYAPTSPSVRCKTNDILVSRINPRIVRICVVPDFGKPVACSPEFAVLRCHDDVDPWLLSLVLRSRLVQNQIQTLTSGTSSSHNRIKVRELSAVSIPMPTESHPQSAEFLKSSATYKRQLDSYYKTVRSTLDCINDIEGLFK